MSETRFATVSEWMENGNINEYVKAHPDKDRLKLVGSHSQPSFPRVDDNWHLLAGWCR